MRLSLDHFPDKRQGINFFFLFVFFFVSLGTIAQKNKADSLAGLLLSEKKDTNRVRLLWQMAEAVAIYHPDTALLLSQQALYLSREIKYQEGQSKSLGALANTFVKIGNYPRAIELYLEKLKLEEQRNTPRNLASVLINLGVVNVLQQEYNKALEYYAQADQVVREYNVEDMKYFILLNLGDVYNRLNKSDSSYRYFSQSLQLAENLKDNDLIGTSMTGLAHCYLKMKNYQRAQFNYQQAISYLRTANDDEILCEATLGIAGLYEQINKPDSAKFYAALSLRTAEKSGFFSPQLEAAQFLTNHYREDKNIDSAFAYVNQVLRINDTINSKSRIREAQILSTNEQLRQLEIKENKKIAAKERFKQLQLLFIGIFIPGFFLFTLSLSRFRIDVRIIKMLGVISLLIFFEYLTLLMHPFVGELTHHIPVYEILIFVIIAAILIPIHHRIEHWLVERLVRNRTTKQSFALNRKPVKLKKKDASGEPAVLKNETDVSVATENKNPDVATVKSESGPEL